MTSRRLPGGLLAVVWVLWASLAAGQQVQFPMRLPPSTPVRTASQTAAEPAPPQSVTQEVLPALVPADDAAYIESPGGVVSDPCFPTTTIVPTYPQPAYEQYRWQFYGDFLWLQARDAGVAYAVPINGVIVPPAGAAPLQIGPVAMVDPELTPGFRAGLSRVLRFPIRVGASYTRFESSGSGSLGVDAPDVNYPLVIHPGTDAGLPDFLDAQAGCGVDFELIDADLRGMIVCDGNYTVDWVVGGRYARLQQDFHANFFDAETVEHVTSQIGFDGGGLRVGLEAERRSSHTGFLAYGRAGASFVAGQFHAGYSQIENIRGTLVDTGLEADRIVPILDLELGVGWTGPREMFRLAAAYMISAWYNAVTTGEFIRAVQENNFVDVSDALSFDGLVARAEVRF